MDSSVSAPNPDRLGICAIFEILDFEKMAGAKLAQTLQSSLDELKTPGSLSPGIVPVTALELDAEFSLKLNSLEVIDKVILAFPLSICLEGPATPRNSLVTILFLERCQRFFSKMFQEGYPLRGAISVGETLIDPYRFSGAALAEARRFCEEQEWISCALTNAAHNFVRDELFLSHYKLAPFAEIFLEEFSAPAKSERSPVLNWAFPKTKGARRLEGNIRESLFKSAMRHNRDLSSATKSRINNTEPFLIYCKDRAETFLSDFPTVLPTILPPKLFIPMETAHLNGEMNGHAALPQIGMRANAAR